VLSEAMISVIAIKEAEVKFC